MKKVSIVTERNIEDNSYNITKIVIFDEGKAPEIINYQGASDLLAVINFAEKNGFNISEKGGLKPAIDTGLVQILSNANKKAMDELDEEIRKQEESVKANDTEVEESLEEEIGKISSEIEENQEGKINSETTMFTPVEKNKINLSDEDREMAEYFRLDILRSQRQLPPVGLSRIQELKANNKKIEELEMSREDVILALDNLNTFEDQNSESATVAKNELKTKKDEYDKLRSKYRAELADAIKNSKSSEDKEEKITENNTSFVPIERNRLDLSEEDREFAEYLRLNILRSRKQLPPVGLNRIEELRENNYKIKALEKTRQNVFLALDKLNSIKDTDSAEAKLARRELADREKEYDELHMMYRKEFADAIKNAKVVESNKEVQQPETQLARTETNNFELTEENNISQDETLNNVEDITTDNDKVVESNDGVKDEAIVDNVVETDEKLNSPSLPVPFNSRRRVVRNAIDPKPIKNQENNDAKTNSVIELGPVTTDNDTEIKTEEETVDYNNTEKVNDTKTTGLKLVADDEPKEVKGLNVTPEAEEDYNVDGKTIKVRKSSKLKELLKRFTAGFLGIVAGLSAVSGINSLIKRFKNQNNLTNYQNNLTVVETPEIEEYDNNLTVVETPKVEEYNYNNNNNNSNSNSNNNSFNKVEVSPIILDYCNAYQIPEQTRNFLQSAPVMEFLSQYKNESQIKEVLSALCYGYETNILMTKDGNFRLAEDGSNYLTSFTHDFLCAKAVVNRYSARQMLDLFGGYDISYEEMMNGFKNYCYTVTTYGMNAKEPLPFKYLTNNNSKSTEVLNDLQEKLLTVNISRENGTLTSDQTDDFIAKVFEIYVQNDESLALSEGIKTVGVALIDSYAAMQSQIDNGEALYLHADRGYAKAGINLADVDGHFTLQYPDKTHYEFTSLYDVINHGYGSIDETNERCVTQQQELLSSINTMHTLANSNVDTARLELANALYKAGYNVFGTKITAGEISDALLDQILSFDPTFTDEVDTYRYAMNHSDFEYVGFETTTEGVDRLLGIQNRPVNNYADLINNRRSSLYLYDNYTITSGERYTMASGGHNYSTDKSHGIGSRTEVVETHEQITREEMTEDEKKQADEQIAELQKKEEEEHKKQEEQLEQAKDELREGVQNGMTQEQLEQKAEDYGIELDPNYQEEMQKALEEQRQGEEKKEQIEQQVEEHNEQAEREAEERRKAEEARQEEERRQQEELIRQSMEIDQEEMEDSQPIEQPEEYQPDQTQPETQDTQDNTDAPIVDQTDDQRVDTNAGEEPYVPYETASQDSDTEAQVVALSDDTSDATDNNEIVEQEEQVQEDQVPVEAVQEVQVQEEQAPVETVQEVQVQEESVQQPEIQNVQENYEAPVVDQTDEQRVDTNAGEEPYVQTASIKQDLENLRQLAALGFDLDNVDNLEVEEQTHRLV